MRRFPRFTGHEIFRDGAGFGGLAGGQIRIGQLRLRFVHRRFEPAVDADLHELEEGRDMRGPSGHEPLKHGRRRLELAGANRGVDDAVDADKGGIGCRL